MELQVIKSKIYEIRGMKVMFDYDLAQIYQVETKNLKRQVKRNLDRFPPDFMFELTKDEYESLRCQIGTLNEQGRGQHPKYLPYVFTEQGVAQLSSVLNSQFAIKVNIEIIRAFVVLRQYALGYAELNAKLEAYMQQNDAKINDVYLALDELLTQKRLYENRKPIGFNLHNRDANGLR
ncbi:DNA-binding protein [Bacteroidia bacterium]|nr:DNA-binding protein [Bacteroidia bacterium]